MNILFVECRGLGLKVEEEGHNVFFYNNELPLKTKDNRVIKKNVRELLSSNKIELVIFGGRGWGKVADYMKELRVGVLGSSWVGDNITHNLKYTSTLLKQMDIDADIIHGVRVNCGMWWNGVSATTYYISLTNSHFMNGGVGVRVGSAGCIIKTVIKNSLIVKESVGKMERLLKKINYRGMVVMHLTLTPSHLVCNGITMGFVGDEIQTLFELYKGEVTQFLVSTSNGVEGDGTFTSDYSLSVRLSLPPYPHSNSLGERVKIEGVNSFNKKHIWWDEVEINEGISSRGGVVGCVVARGRNQNECRSRVYRTIGNLNGEGLQYRTDIGQVDQMQHILKWL